MRNPIKPRSRKFLALAMSLGLVTTIFSAAPSAFAASLSVSYNGNGASGTAPTDSTPYNFNDPVTVLGLNGLYRTGYTFGGWATGGGGMGPGTTYQPGDTFRITTDTPLTALWTLNAVTYSVTYNGNGQSGGAAPSDSGSYPSGASVTVMGQNGLYRTGYTFGGWASGGGAGPGTTYQPGQTFTITTNTTLSAVWTLNAVTYSVTYAGNGNTGGSTPTDSNAYASGASVTVLPVGSLVKTGYTFGGWATGGGGGPGTTYQPGQTFSISVNTTLTAVWKAAATLTMTYNGIGSTSGTAPVDPNSPYVSGATVTVLGAGTLVKTGYSFGGWTDCVINHAYGTTFIITSNTAVCPLWTINPYAVHYLATGSTSGTPPSDPNSPYPSGATVTVLGAGSLVKTGYHFGGWADADTHITTGATFIILKVTDLDPVWIPTTYTVTYFGTGSDSGTPPIDPSSPYASGASVTLLGHGNLTKFQNTFGGWTDCSTPSILGSPLIILHDVHLCPAWIPTVTYTVIYFPFQTTSGVPPVDILSPYSAGDVVFVLGAGTLVKTGYTFNGWGTCPAVTTVGTSFVIHNDTTLCSLWVIDSKFKVTYLGNGQSTGNPPPIASGSGYVAILGNTGSMTKSGYVFSGWNTKANGLGTPYAIGFLYNRIADLTLYAVWTPAKTTYTITYDGNGNSGGSAPSPTTGAGSVTLAVNSGLLIKSGNHFGNWNTKADGTGISYSLGSSYNLIANITLFAMWAPNTYTITYDGNGFTSGVVPNPTVGSGLVTLATNNGALAKSGSNYAGWNTAADGSGTSYSVGDPYTLSADITLYAVWLPITYSVTYVGNGNTSGTVPVDITAYSSGGTVIVLGPNTLVNTGYTFGGWAIGGLVIYAPGQTFTITGDTILTAVWTPNVVYTITYDGNGNSGGTVPSPTVGSGLVTLATNSGALVQSGSTFGGWNTSSDGSGTAYAVGSPYTLNANITLYAVWMGGGMTNCTITYNGNGFTGGSVPSPTVGMGSVTLATNSGSLVRANYTFGGWNTTPDGSGTPYAVGSNYNLIADITLYAVWHAISIPVYTITYLGNGHTSGSAPLPTVGLGSVTLATNSGALGKSGSTFGGWNTTADGSGTPYSVGSNYTLFADINLYAVWHAGNIVYTITYSGNGNSGGSVPSPTVGSGPVTLATNSGALVKSGSSFAGWNTAVDGSGTPYAVGSPYTLNANVTLYAVWIGGGITNYTITYNGNGFSGGSVPSPTVGLGSVTLATNSGSLVKSGYSFSGWNTIADGSGTPFTVGSNYNLIADITLYAVWHPIAIPVYTITYLGNGYTSGSAPSPTVGLGSVTLATNTGALGKSSSIFGGWNTSADGSGTPYAVGSNYTLLADITLYAVWHAVNVIYTITYLGNTNTGGVAPHPTLGAGSVNLAINSGPLVKSGSTFGGWNTSAGGSGTPYAVGSNYTLLADVNLYAVWNAGNPVFTITYSGNTNTGGVIPTPTVGSGSVTLAANSSPLVKTGFAFGGWNTNADGSGVNYPERGNYNLTANVTLYAVWSTYTTYTITYLGNGNTGGTVPSPTVGSGSVILATNSGTLSKTGFTFAGWNTKADRSGASYLVGSSYNLTANTTLYAAYIPLPLSETIPDIIANGKIINTSPPKKIALNQIVPVHQQFLTVLPNNAVGFELYENGKLITRGTSTRVDLTQIVGPKDRVTVAAVSKDGLKSVPASVPLAKEPISLANINFNTDSYKFIGPATKILDQVAAVIIQHGYTVLEIWGYVDTQGSKASWITLSNNRAKAVKDYMTKKLKGSGVLIKNAGRAQTQAVGNNNTAEGRALNRRVEIRVS